jgi:polysaccharide biosynthesis/export protein
VIVAAVRIACRRVRANTAPVTLRPWSLLCRIAVLLAIAGSLGMSCGTRVPDYDYASEPDPRQSEYVLGVGDHIAIHVWEQHGLNTDAVIRPDGTITMPLIGDLKAAGATPSQLKEMIRGRLEEFVQGLEGSEITVAVRGANSYRFTVSGEVVRPGVYTENYFVTVGEAIALAGGFTRFGKKNEMVLMRRDPKSGQTRTIPLVYDLLATGRRPDMNIVILSGDLLHVP